MLFVHKIILSLLVLFLSIPLFSQNGMREKENALGLTVIANRTAGYEIQRNYPKNKELDVDGAAPFGLELKLDYQKRLNDKIRMRAGVLAGYYSVNYKLLARIDFLDIEQGESQYTELTYAGRRIPYGGLSLGIDYGIFQTEKTGLFVGLAANILYFLHPEKHTHYMNVPINFALRTTLRTNIWEDTKRLKIFPEISLTYRKQLGERFVFSTGITGIYSNYEIVSSGKYEIFGDHEIRTGSFSKKFAHIGLNVGMCYSF